MAYLRSPELARTSSHRCRMGIFSLFKSRELSWWEASWGYRRVQVPLSLGLLSSLCFNIFCYHWLLVLVGSYPGEWCPGGRCCRSVPPLICCALLGVLVLRVCSRLCGALPTSFRGRSPRPYTVHNISWRCTRLLCPITLHGVIILQFLLLKFPHQFAGIFLRFRSGCHF